jgi:hypothetical protein
MNSPETSFRLRGAIKNRRDAEWTAVKKTQGYKQWLERKEQLFEALKAVPYDADDSVYDAAMNDLNAHLALMP